MSLLAWMTLLLAMVALAVSIASLVVLWKQARRMVEAARDCLSPLRRANRWTEKAAYERWRREGGGAWLDSWWDSPEAGGREAREAASGPDRPGRMSIEEARRKLDALSELTIARGATPAEAAAARAIAERLKAEYDLS
jgi:hypothetical protein